jgi:beta-lactam-binding protein with PASTA domain
VQKRLSKLDLKVDIKFEENTDVDDGEIIRHIPEGGAVVKAGDVIVLYVSKPDTEVIKPIEVPYLVGLTYTQAKEVIAENTVGHGKSQNAAYKTEKVEHLLAFFAIRQSKDR